MQWPCSTKPAIIRWLFLSSFWSMLCFKVLLQFIWRRGSKDSRGQGFKGLFSKGFISVLTFFRFLLCLFLLYPIHLFQLNLNPLLIISEQNNKINAGVFVDLTPPSFFFIISIALTLSLPNYDVLLRL